MERPKHLIKVNQEALSNLISLCEYYIHLVEMGNSEDTNYDHYIFEAAMILVYGPDVFKWINGKTQ